MASKAVFLDRDGTIMEDREYLDDPAGVKLLPGAELAIKSLSQAGYKIVVVTNQSGVARGLLSEETLRKIHEELQRQLAEKGAKLDGIYSCPFHPEGTVEEYAMESSLRKPAPGMLLKAAEELDIDLSSSWMVGDSGRDIEAGRAAGCRTILIRTPARPHSATTEHRPQADACVRNLVDAARVILREEGSSPPSRAAAGRDPAAGPKTGDLAPVDTEQQPVSDSEVRMEILRHLRQFVRSQHEEEFSFTKLIGSIVQMLTLLAVVIGVIKMVMDELQAATLWLQIALVFQVMALTAFSVGRKK